VARGFRLLRDSRGQFTTEDTEYRESFANIRSLLGRPAFRKQPSSFILDWSGGSERFVYADGLDGYRRMMEAQERQLVMEQLVSSEARLLGLVEGLTQAQWRFREDAERWSIAEILEHLVVFEGFITAAVTNALKGPAESEKTALAGAKEPLVLGLAESRDKKLKAREATRPAGRWVDGAELIAEFRSARARTIAFAAETECDLRGHFFPHIAFGDLDCYQWLVVLGQHTLRHCLQIEKILGDLRFPAG
jgi:hypothetical protein